MAQKATKTFRLWERVSLGKRLLKRVLFIRIPISDKRKIEGSIIDASDSTFAPLVFCNTLSVAIGLAGVTSSAQVGSSKITNEEVCNDEEGIGYKVYKELHLLLNVSFVTART